MNNRDLAHRWANQTQPAGKASNFFFEGPRLFSYGHHFEVARILPDGVVLFNSRTYSVSTSKHQRYARQAVESGTLTFSVPSFEDHARNVDYFLKAAESLKAQTIRARSHAEFLANQTGGEVMTAWRYCETFKKEIPVKLRNAAKKLEKARAAGTLFSDEERQRIKAIMAASLKERQEAKKRRAVKEAEEQKRQLTLLDLWAAGEPIDERLNFEYDLPTALRIKDKRIETSRGAQITLRAALALWGALTSGADVAGMDLDGYTVNKWDGETLTVGCHKIPATELKKLAGVLGLPGVLK